MENSMVAGRRAGFWRRFAALLIDGLVVLVPLQILVAVLFASTNGGVQGTFGFVVNVCGPVDPVPTDLQPPPPDGANQATLCSASFFGFETARTLTVATVETTSNDTSSIYRTYGVSADGSVRDDVIATDMFAFIALLAYLVLMEFRRGATLGKRVLGLKVVDSNDPDTPGIPLRKAVMRYVVLLLGSAVPVGMMFLPLFLSETATDFASWMPLLIIGGIINFAWLVWIIVSVARKTDPIYDRLVGTAVVLK